MADKNKIDDMDFSELDLDSDDVFDENIFSDEKPAEFDGDDSEEPSAKKKPDVFTLAVYGVVGLCVIGVIVWQLGLLGPKNSASYTAPPVAASETGPVPIPGTEAADALTAGQIVEPAPSDPFNVMGTPEQGVQAENAEATLMEAMNPADIQVPQAAPEGLVTGVISNGEGAGTTQNVTPQDLTPTTQVGDTVPLPAPVPANQALPSAAADAVLAAMPAPTIQAQTPEPMTEPVTEAMPVNAAAPVSSETSAVSSDNAALTTIMARLDTIEQRLNAKENEPSPAIAQELQELKQTVSMLQNNMSASSKMSVQETKSALSEPVKKKKTARKKVSSDSKRKNSTSEWDKPYNSGAAKDGQTISKAKPEYTLRAAQPDMAWVSASDGELRQVRVGDSLPGIGTVTGIVQSGGQWSVSASEGRISQ